MATIDHFLTSARSGSCVETKFAEQPLFERQHFVTRDVLVSMQKKITFTDVQISSEQSYQRSAGEALSPQRCRNERDAKAALGGLRGGEHGVNAQELARLQGLQAVQLS